MGVLTNLLSQAIGFIVMGAAVALIAAFFGLFDGRNGGSGS